MIITPLSSCCPNPNPTPVGHANQQDVVEGVHAVDLGQQLVDDGVVRARAVAHAAALPADGVDLVKDDDVQLLGRWVVCDGWGEAGGLGGADGR